MTTILLAKRVVAPDMLMEFVDAGYRRGTGGRPPSGDRVRLFRVQAREVGMAREAFPDDRDHSAYVLDKSFAGQNVGVILVSRDHFAVHYLPVRRNHIGAEERDHSGDKKA